MKKLQHEMDGRIEYHCLHALANWAENRHCNEFLDRLHAYTKLAKYIVDASPTEKLSVERQRRIRRIAVKLQMLHQFTMLASANPQRRYILEKVVDNPYHID